MRTSQYFIPTQKEIPSEAVSISHQLMLRAGMIRKLSSGLYTWLPLGLRTIKKAQEIIREEMNLIHGLEILMPITQPAEIWKKSGRWEEYGPELLRLKDRHNRDFCIGPTHEEVITSLCYNEINSYRQLPVIFYQIQSKFRDEIRPRFGVMRSREFIMKDAYSFHADDTCLRKTYSSVYEAYCKIFKRLGLEFRVVEADNGLIGGASSHEFHVLASSGEDEIAFSTESDYAVNIEKAKAVPEADANQSPEKEALRLITDPGGWQQLKRKYSVNDKNIIKTFLVESSNKDKLVKLLIRWDHQLNEIKAANHPLVAAPLKIVNDEEVTTYINSLTKTSCPLHPEIKIIIDSSVGEMKNFSIRTDRRNEYFLGANWDRDLPKPEIYDLRKVVNGDPSPDGKGTLKIKRGIEVGHIFQLGLKYSDALRWKILNQNGEPTGLFMGCYGIGISRIIAAAIEQGSNSNGIFWPNEALAPFKISLIPVRYKDPLVKKHTDTIYRELVSANLDVLLDDRDHRISTGVKFADADLIGIPHRLLITTKLLSEGNVEYKNRTSKLPEVISIKNLVSFLKKRQVSR